MYNDFHTYLDENKCRLNMAKTHFDSLLGAELDYFGADDAENTFNVDGVVFKVLEDPSDGYRSYMGAIDYTDKSTSIFFSVPIARIRVEKYEGESSEYSEGNTGFRFVDVRDGHVWLEFGTDNTDDYYPYFVFRHMPSPGLLLMRRDD